MQVRMAEIAFLPVRYSQIELDGLATIFAVYNQYLNGEKLVLSTNNKPLLRISNSERGFLSFLPTNKIVVVLHYYDFGIHFVYSKANTNFGLSLLSVTREGNENWKTSELNNVHFF